MQWVGMRSGFADLWLHGYKCNMFWRQQVGLALLQMGIESTDDVENTRQETMFTREAALLVFLLTSWFEQGSTLHVVFVS